MEREAPVDIQPKPYEPIDGLYDAFDKYTVSSILDGSTTDEDLVHAAYMLAGRSSIGCEDDFDLLALAQEELEALKREYPTLPQID